MFLSAGAVLIVAAITPASVRATAQMAGDLPRLSYDLSSYSPAPVQKDDAQPAAPTAEVDQASLACVAKVVHHESRGQPRRGMVAVAQTLLNRVKAGRFGENVCAVANQPGQYFNTAHYHPESSSGWQTSVEVARSALDGSAEDAAQGALFFHAAYRAPSSFFRSRQRVATIGGQVFYR